MADINVTVSPNPNRNIIIGSPGNIFTPLDYRQGIVDLTSGVSDLSFAFSAPFAIDPVFGGEIIYNGGTFDDGYGYHVYNLKKTGCNVCLSEEMHTTGYQFHYYATAF